MVTVADLSKLAAFPPVATRLLNLLSGDEVNIQAAVEVIRTDPAFTAQILQRANSPLFGFGSRIDSLHQALALLGWYQVRKLTITVATGSYIRAANKMEELRRCWRHTVACALLTEELAWTCMEQQDLAYTAGLLHDIGRLALLVARPEEYAGLLKAANDESIDILDRERELFGMDHCEAGRQLAELWHLPKEFHVIAGRHHDEPTSSEVDLLLLVHLGCRFADTLGYGVVKSERTWTVEQIRAALPEAAQGRFHVDLDQMKASLEAELEMFDNPAGVKPEIADVQPEQPDFSVPEVAVVPRGIPYRQAAIGVGAVLAAAILIMLALSR